LSAIFLKEGFPTSGNDMHVSVLMNLLEFEFDDWCLNIGIYLEFWLLMIGYYNVRRIHEATGFDSDGK